MNKLITLAAAVVSAITSSAATLNVPGTYADIASALAVAQDGDIVQVAAGEYTLSTVDPLDIPAGVTLKGAGAATTTVKAYANAVTEKVSASLLVATNLNCVIDGITFSGAYCYSDFSMPSVLDAAQGAVIKNCVFAGNTIKDKGYLARIMNAGTTLTNCVFRNTTLTGGNNYTSGSSVYVADAAEIMDCVFSNNFNRVNGGSGFVTLTTGAKVRRTTLAKNTLYSREKYQGTAPLTVLSTCTIDCLVEDCVLEDNAVGSDTAAGKVYQAAGGLAIMGPATVRRTIVRRNTAGNPKAAGIYCKGAATFENVLVANNTLNSPGTENAAGIFVDNVAATFKNVTVVGNVSKVTTNTKAHGAYLYGATAVNSMFYGNGPSETATVSGNLKVAGANGCVTYSLVTSSAECENASNASSGTGCRTGDPLFTEAIGGDYTLTSLSPCLDVGNSETGVTDDLRGIARPKNFGVDLGCYECEYAAVYECGVAPVSRKIGPGGGEVTFTATPTMAAAVTRVAWTVTAESGTAPTAADGFSTTVSFPAGENAYTVTATVYWQGDHSAESAATAVSVVETVDIAPGDDLFAALAELDGLSSVNPVKVKLAAGTYTAAMSGASGVTGADYLYTVKAGVIFEGAGEGLTILDGESAHPVLKVLADGAAKKLLIVNAKAPGDAAAVAGFSADVAGALEHVVISNGVATSGTAYENELVVRSGGSATDCVVRDCSHGYGKGGIVYTAGTLTRVKILDNVVNSTVGSALVVNGAGALVEESEISGNIANNLPEHSVGTSGVVLRNGGTIRTTAICNNQMTIPRAYADFAGGLAIDGGAGSLVERCTITNNVCVHVNGGFYYSFGAGIAARAASTIRNCLVADNRVTSCATAPGWPTAAGIYMGVTNVVVESCTIVGNKAVSGSTVRDLGVVRIGNGTTYGGALDNSIVWTEGISSPISNVVGTVGASWTTDPTFISGTYRLSSLSPCRNAGANQDWMLDAVDLAGTTRILEDVVDLGCREYDPDADRLCVFASLSAEVTADDKAFTVTADAEPKETLYGYEWTFDCGGEKTIITNTVASLEQQLPTVGTYTISVKALWGTAGNIKAALVSETVRMLTVKPRTVEVSVVGTTYAQALAAVYIDADDPGVVTFAAGTYTAAVLDAEADYLVTVPAGVIFEGAGIGQTILDGENTYRVLKVLAGGSAKKLSITGAKAPGTAGSTLTGIAADVAGVLSDVDITGNDWTTGLDPECDVVVRAGGTLDGAEIHDLNHPNNTRGGIVYAYGTVKNTKVYRNSIQSAYPVFGVIGTTALAENCDIYGNTLRSREHSVGTAGILLQNGGTVRGCRIYSNTANPAAWYGYAGGIYINSGSGSLVEGCIVTNNVCGYHNNICNDFAGGIDAPAAATIRNTLVANNRVTGYFATGKYPVAGGIYLGNAGGVVENCTVVGNRVNGITDTTERGILSAKGTVRNTIVWDNALSNTAATVTYTCAAGLAAENGNLASDPKFRRGGYLLKSASPCRDSGTNLVWMAEATDLLSNPRIQADGVDMGCYEMPPAPGMLLLLK